MATTTNIYLDKRAVKHGEKAPLRIGINKHGQTAFITLDVKILPSQWDDVKKKVKDAENKDVINGYLSAMKVRVDNALMVLQANGSLAGLSAKEVKDRIQEYLNPTEDRGLFLKFYREDIRKYTNKRTREIYQTTLNRIKDFDGNAERLCFEDITKIWLERFDEFLSKTAPSVNARNIHLRNIRHIINDAIDDNQTGWYPFRRFKIRPEKTKKRALTVSQLRTLFEAETKPHERKYLDAFKLIFFLIGINIKDLCDVSGVTDGRVEYRRAKTKRLYSIKVEPEIQEIIDRIHGERSIAGASEGYASYKSYAAKVNNAVKDICERNGLPKATTYWARHSWATIATDIDIPKETIAAALGHGGNTVTDIYIDFDQKKVDQANRRLMDYVLYGKDWREKAGKDPEAAAE
ncbi:MAG: site-specific integrase [Bacteroidales bacterium]|nr:site-specific integrase [Bacteroidales bacterium]